MRLGLLFSGGKDSCLALHKVLKQGHEVAFLLNVYPINKDSFMFHKPDLKLLRKQAEMLDLPLIIQKTAGKKEKELLDLKKLILRVKDRIDGIVVGGIASSYQGARVKKICDEIGLKFIAPLLNYSPDELWEELLGEGFEVILTKIACEGISKEWIGKVIDKDNFLELRKLAERYKFRLDFEGGEAETSVLWMPEFSHEIKIGFDISSEGRYRHFIRILKII